MGFVKELPVSEVPHQQLQHLVLILLADDDILLKRHLQRAAVGTKPTLGFGSGKFRETWGEGTKQPDLAA